MFQNKKLSGIGPQLTALFLMVIPGLLSNSLVLVSAGFIGTALGGVTLILKNRQNTYDYGIYAHGIAWLFVLIAIPVWWSPVYQGIMYASFFVYPILIQSLVMLVLVVAIGFVVYHKKDETIGGAIMFLGVIFVVVFFIAGIFFSGAFAKIDMADRVQSESEEINNIPDTSVENVRIMPQAVARNLARNSLQTPKYRLSNGDISFINGTPQWSWSLVPDSIVNHYIEKQIGGVYVNQSDIKQNIVTKDEARFKYGNGMGLRDNIYWQLIREDYWASYQDSFVFPEGGEQHIAVPYVKHDVRFKFPFFYSVPKFGGVKLVEQDGTIQNLSPSEVSKNEELSGQNYYPYDLARFKVESMYYRTGSIINAHFIHDNQIVVPTVPGQGNNQPFTVPTEEGIKYFVAAEPYGSTSNGVKEMWIIDGKNGETKYIKYDDNMRGARKAIESVMGEPEISRLTDAQGVEPLPVVVDNDLYWMIRVVPSTSARVSKVAFLNAKNGDIKIVSTNQEIRSFLSGNTEVIQQPTQQNNISISSALSVQIQRENGTLENKTIQEGGSITIKPSKVENTSR